MTKRDEKLPKLDAEGYCTVCKFKHPCECVPFCETCEEPETDCVCVGYEELTDRYAADADEAHYMDGHGTPQIDPFWMGDH